MIVQTSGFKVARTSMQKTFTLRCPACNAYGIFVPVEGISGQHEICIVDKTNPDANFLFHGDRQCSNDECGCVISFWMYENHSSPVATWPASKAEFDTKHVPVEVVTAFREVLDCEAHGSFIASAILLRKTMEEICGNQQAAGNDLEKRIEALKAQGNISPKLTDTLHEIRYLGNDAAHLTAKVFQKGIGKQEVNVGIEIVREIIRQLYQTEHLKGKIDALK